VTDGPPQTDESTPEKKKPSGCLLLFLVIVGISVVAGVASSLHHGQGASTGRGESGGDGAASAACQHYHDVAADAKAGILTTEELRTKLREVYETARASHSPAVASAATNMLAAITSGTPDELGTASTNFSYACAAIGD
jgi:hypothetical protein